MWQEKERLMTEKDEHVLVAQVWFIPHLRPELCSDPGARVEQHSQKNLSKTEMYQIKAFLFKSRNFTRSHTPFPGVKQPINKISDSNLVAMWTGDNP